MNLYTIRRATSAPPSPKPDWENAAWIPAQTAEIRYFLPESSLHRPRTFVRLLHTETDLHGIFNVQDQFVRCVRTRYFDEVWKDSCVEFFAQPLPGRGYFNFEFNCGGALLCSHILNPERTPDGFKDFAKLPEAIGTRVQVAASLPQVVDPELADPTEWTLRFTIPLSVFEEYLGPLGPLTGQAWRGNFYKCAEEVSRPHWAAWSPVDRFDFHRPKCFGSMVFE